METFLNLAWATLALSSICLWARLEHRTGDKRRLAIVALLMSIVVLFPVISVSDDLRPLQNPAETDVFQRRDHFVASAHPIAPALHAFCMPGFSDIVLAVRDADSLPNVSISMPPPSPLARIQSRPPPAA